MQDIAAVCRELLSEPDQYFYHKTFQRHLDDLERFKDSDVMQFNEALANDYVKVIESLKHFKGELAGTYLVLELWQIAVIGILAGWEKVNKKGEWVRRFSTALIFIARKNGKSLFASGFTIADIILRSEQGNECWFFASKRDQARLCFDGVDKMMDMHKRLRALKHHAYSTITFKYNDSTFKTLGRDSKSEDGFSAGIGVADEIHSHPDRSLYDVVASSMGARKQPLMLMITTAGFNLESPLTPEYDYSKSILNGVVVDDDYFAFIAEPDLKRVEDDPDYRFTIDALKAANPNFGVSVKEDFLLKEAANAKARPELLNNYLVKHLDLFVAQDEIYIPIDKWKACKSDEVPPLEQALYKFIGLDLSLNDDFTSKAVLYMFSNNLFYLTTHHYIPADTLDLQARKLRVPLRKWVEMGYITATKGDTIDVDYIFEDIKKDLDTEIMTEIGYDPNRAKGLIAKLENDLGYRDSVKVIQSPYTLTEPTKLLLDIVRRGELTYLDNPATNWHISNMSVDIKPDGRMIPDKSKNTRKIDGAAAIIDALALALFRFDETEGNLFAIV